MAAPTPEELESFGDLIQPFQRNARGKTIADLNEFHKINSIESAIGDKIYDAVNDGLPNYPIEIIHVTHDTLIQIQRRQLENKKEYCFLWILDTEGIKILWENTENLLDVASREVKHTNITGGGSAFHGGELFFSADNKIYVNNQSDRYGDSAKDHWDATIAYFRKTYIQFQIIDLKDADI